MRCTNLEIALLKNEINSIKNELAFLNSKYANLLVLKLKLKSLSLIKKIINSLNKIACKIIFLNKKLILINVKISDSNLINYNRKFRGIINHTEEYLLDKYYTCDEEVKKLSELNREITIIKAHKKHGNYNVVFKKLKALVKKFI